MKVIDLIELLQQYPISDEVYIPDDLHGQLPVKKVTPIEMDGPYMVLHVSGQVPKYNAVIIESDHEKMGL